MRMLLVVTIRDGLLSVPLSITRKQGCARALISEACRPFVDSTVHVPCGTSCLISTSFHVMLETALQFAADCFWETRAEVVMSQMVIDPRRGAC